MDTLLFIENQHLLKLADEHRDLTVEWRRFLWSGCSAWQAIRLNGKCSFRRG